MFLRRDWSEGLVGQAYFASFEVKESHGSLRGPKVQMLETEENYLSWHY